MTKSESNRQLLHGIIVDGIKVCGGCCIAAVTRQAGTALRGACGARTPAVGEAFPIFAPGHHLTSSGNSGRKLRRNFELNHQNDN